MLNESHHLETPRAIIFMKRKLTELAGIVVRNLTNETSKINWKELRKNPNEWIESRMIEIRDHHLPFLKGAVFGDNKEGKYDSIEFVLREIKKTDDSQTEGKRLNKVLMPDPSLNTTKKIGPEPVAQWSGIYDEYARVAKNSYDNDLSYEERLGLYETEKINHQFIEARDAYNKVMDEREAQNN